jgi:hypothetical protein
MADQKSEAILSPQDAYDWKQRAVDYSRHIQDLRTKSYEGAVSREGREEIFLRAFDLVSPVAERVLEELNATFLSSSGRISTHLPVRSVDGGLSGSWSLTWRLQEQAKNRFDQSPLQPLSIYAIFPLTPTGLMQWTHPHFALLRPACRDGLGAAFPLQVTSEEDAWRQEPILRVLAEAEMHERTYQSDLNWRLLSSLYEAPTER